MNCRICNGTNNYRIFSLKGEDFYKCRQCNLIFQYPINDKKVEQYYSDEYLNRDQRFVSQFYNWFTRYRDTRVINLIKKYRTGGDLLDIGAAYGGFLEVARDNGFNVFGIEPNKEGVRVAKEKFGIDLDNTFFSESYNRHQTFDVITSFHVIEHTVYPAGFMQNIYRHLKRDGIVVLETPNVQSVNALVMGKNWPLYSPNEHLFNFSFRSLGILLERNGFQIIYKKRTGIFIHKKGQRLTGKIRSEKGSKIVKLLNILNTTASEKLRLGDNLVIVAKKR